MIRTAVNLLLPISLAVGVCLCRGQRSGPPISWGTGMSPVPHRSAGRDLPAGVSAVDLSAPKPAVKAFEKGLKAWDKGQLAEAEQAFKNAILLYPSFASAYNNLGVVFLHEGRRDDAEWAFRQSLNVDGRSRAALRNLAFTLFEERQYAYAGQLLNRLSAIEPMNQEASLLLAQIDFALARFDSVVAIASRTHNSFPDHNGYINFLAASALEQEGREPEAMSEYVIFLEESPHDPHAKISAERIEAIRKDGGMK